MCSMQDDPSQHDTPRGSEVPDRAGDQGARGVPGAVATEEQVPPTTLTPPTGIPFTTPDRSGAYLFLSTLQLNLLNGLLKDLQVIDRFFGSEETITPIWRLELHIQVTDALLKLQDNDEVVTNVGPDQQDQAHELARIHAAKVAGIDRGG
jgi:hypothetical protein